MHVICSSGNDFSFVIAGLMTFEFKLSYNASVLNQWSYKPLILSGIIDREEAPPPIIKPGRFTEFHLNHFPLARNSQQTTLKKFRQKEKLLVEFKFFISNKLLALDC